MSSVDLLGSQSGHGGDRKISTCASRLTQDGEGGAGFCDGSVVGDDRSRETRAANRIESAFLKVKLIPGFHGIFNLQMLEAILLRAL